LDGLEFEIRCGSKLELVSAWRGLMSRAKRLSAKLFLEARVLFLEREGCVCAAFKSNVMSEIQRGVAVAHRNGVKATDFE
jgi:hypothetical protein